MGLRRDRPLKEEKGKGCQQKFKKTLNRREVLPSRTVERMQTRSTALGTRQALRRSVPP